MYNIFSNLPRKSLMYQEKTLTYQGISNVRTKKKSNVSRKSTMHQGKV